MLKRAIHPKEGIKKARQGKRKDSMILTPRLQGREESKGKRDTTELLIKILWELWE